MEFVGTLLLIAILLYLLMPVLRNWFIRWVIGRIQQRAQDHMRQGASSSRHAASQDASSQKKEKMDMDEIEAKRFDKENSDDYVDFEELPK
ncbi:MAG: DUF4834 family protein [Porphyromonadaceae bacterium]|nr:DUF4834 family protein [Porphyromonadaceae bacterium]